MLETHQVHQARTEWFETGRLREQTVKHVRPEILASWRRSRAFGAQPNVASLPYHEDRSGTNRLVDAAEPVLRVLADSLAGLHAGVLLADRDANIVKRWVADRALLPHLDRICSDAGFGAAEDTIGTNGVGTVAESGRAMMVVGPEHYADALVGFACVGVPIHSPTTRRLEGIITLSCRADAANALLTPLMMGTAADIEHRLLESTSFEERRMLDEYLAARRCQRLVAAIGRDMLIAGARASRVLDELADRNVMWDAVSELVAAAGQTSRVMPTTSGEEIGLTFTPIRESGRLIGALIDIDDHAEMPSSRRPRSSTGVGVIRLPGDSSGWVTVLEAATRFARDRVPTVLTGEQGVGKYTLARKMIDSGGEPGSVTEVDCRDLSTDELERLTTTPLAVGSTLVLRRLDTIDQRCVAAISRWLEVEAGQDIWMLGTCTTASPAAEQATRALLERFHAVALRLPALSERAGDIPAIVRSLVARHAHGRQVDLTADVVRELGRAEWPGNVRQLEDVVRAIVAGRVGEVTTADLPLEVRSSTSRRPLPPIEQLERTAIVKALHDAGGNKVVAAKMIGLSRSTIYRKIRAYGLEDSTFF